MAWGATHVKVSLHSTKAQLAAALVVGGIVVGAAVYWSSGTKGGDTDPCQAASQSPADQTGAKLCRALQHAGLPALLGVPSAKAVYAGQMAAPGTTEEVHVEWNAGQYAVILSTSQTGTVQGTEQLAGHPAALLSGTSNGHQVNRLEVAWRAAGGAGVYAVDVMMADGSTIAQSDAGRLERAVAAKALPGLPEWHAS
ncbi:DUF6215 domain-containing protein [Catenulispora pinisilvae]|uniref:DUF6215 domain-containing protein n=1 Tax=Catenulispora pinisilvae TaxID=2705253 RepID=UPI001890D7F3|nr:DUF6215 domain-containing protein [Catenulispora pinisilvae]